MTRAVLFLLLLYEPLRTYPPKGLADRRPEFRRVEFNLSRFMIYFLSGKALLIIHAAFPPQADKNPPSLRAGPPKSRSRQKLWRTSTELPPWFSAAYSP